MDEDVIKVLLDIPLWEVADLNQPSGAGDKKILREVSDISLMSTLDFSYEPWDTHSAILLWPLVQNFSLY